jgi:hypothetical protein
MEALVEEGRRKAEEKQGALEKRVGELQVKIKIRIHTCFHFI